MPPGVATLQRSRRLGGHLQSLPIVSVVTPSFFGNECSVSYYDARGFDQSHLYFSCNCAEWTLAPWGVIYQLWNKFVDESLRPKVNDSSLTKTDLGESKPNENVRRRCAVYSPRRVVDVAAVDAAGKVPSAICLEDGTFVSPISDEVIRLELSIISQIVFDKVTHFYLCSLCGKIYWDGTHYEKHWLTRNLCEGMSSSSTAKVFTAS